MPFLKQGVCPTLYKRQYIGHARHEGPYPENSLQLFEFLINEQGYDIIEADIVFTVDFCPILHHGLSANVFKNGKPVNVLINKMSFQELKSYSLSPNSFVPFASVDSLFCLASEKEVCVLLDLTFQLYSFSCLRKLYDIVCRYGMQSRTIWGDVNIYKLALINRHMICQVGGSWGRKMLVKSFIRSLLCKQMIMSFSYYGGKIELFEFVAKIGHSLGFLMKVATVNDQEIANRFWKIGTDLMVTDKLLNN